jgi:hypothetical protein
MRIAPLPAGRAESKGSETAAASLRRTTFAARLRTTSRAIPESRETTR